jgi:hypothetical protein
VRRAAFTLSPVAEKSLLGWQLGSRRIVERILTLRNSAPPTRLAKSQGFLLPRQGVRIPLVLALQSALARTAKRAGCFTHVTPHRLRHSFATEMLRLGVSLPALMKLLGNKDIRMTLRYVEVTQQDLQREFHQARQNAPHRLPTLALPKEMPSAGLPSIRQALEAIRHLLEMYRRQLGDEKIRRTLQRLDKRLLGIASQLQKIQQKMRKEWPVNAHSQLHPKARKSQRLVTNDDKLLTPFSSPLGMLLRQCHN